MQQQVFDGAVKDAMDIMCEGKIITGAAETFTNDLQEEHTGRGIVINERVTLMHVYGARGLQFLVLLLVDVLKVIFLSHAPQFLSGASRLFRIGQTTAVT